MGWLETNVCVCYGETGINATTFVLVCPGLHWIYQKLPKFNFPKEKIDNCAKLSILWLFLFVCWWRGRIGAGKKRGGGSAANCPYNGFPGLHQAISFSCLLNTILIMFCHFYFHNHAIFLFILNQVPLYICTFSSN